MINGKKELPYLTITNSSIIFYLELIPCKAEQPLHDMELQEKKYKKIKESWKPVQKEQTARPCRS